MSALPNSFFSKILVTYYQHVSDIGRSVVLLTKHGKQDLIKEVLESDLSCSIAWNTEILLWVDDELSIEVTSTANGTAQNTHREVKTVNF